MWVFSGEKQAECGLCIELNNQQSEYLKVPFHKKNTTLKGKFIILHIKKDGFMDNSVRTNTNYWVI